MQPESGTEVKALESVREVSGTAALVRVKRALQILRQLQAGQTWTVAELAEQFQCSERTIFREVKLMRECGIPIDVPEGERGFRMSQDFFWKPVRPTTEELIALVVGSRMAAATMPDEMRKLMESAVEKIVGSERPAVRERLGELTMRIDAAEGIPKPLLGAYDFLTDLLDYISKQLPLRVILKTDAEQPAAVEMLPERLQFAQGEWVLSGAPLSGGAGLTIRLESIAKLDSIA